ncbi:uncharacterized protein LOC106164735 isoform X1 [Lingula anatina]|uniref:Uncharacterized protein LOC106164735 isoform X1 n=1 Tax=Lingula anatina TaxID=7574 RepID=A0A1S3IJ09_LINAN|nr:uncharacterized protein LOC106164735 isoform X1 [Lingula anatina]XP_023931906.1 uncharacterized protein LOC106164735 isoform X1 [Lingula anatina]|eukprot:XP_013398197.1 uncharacterized protein LOC106164735 isoform X1 [Lingula anatina]
MVRLTCECLNVNIHSKTPNLVTADVANLGLNETLQKEIKYSELAEVQLDLEGISQEHPCLLKKKTVGHWTTYECVNCGLLTHAVNTASRSNRILVNKKLLRDATAIESLMQSPDYSPLYNIVLKGVNDNQHRFTPFGLQSSKYESLQETLTAVQQRLNQYLIQEEAAMEERIRKYQEEQRTQYAKLQSKARRDKNTLISSLLASEAKDLTESLTEAMVDDSSPENSVEASSLTESSSLEQDTRNQNKVSPVQQQDKKSQSNYQSHQLLQRTTSAPVRLQSNRSLDEVFELEGLDDDEDLPAFDESDDDTDNSMNEDQSDSSDRDSGIYSRSIPISVPMAFRTGKFSEREEEDVYKTAPDPEHMAASIKALALSVHEDGTEMFGDLPRPRHNTWGDHHRPHRSFRH